MNNAQSMSFSLIMWHRTVQHVVHDQFDVVCETHNECKHQTDAFAINKHAISIATNKHLHSNATYQPQNSGYTAMGRTESNSILDMAQFTGANVPS